MVSMIATKIFQISNELLTAQQAPWYYHPTFGSIPSTCRERLKHKFRLNPI